MLKRLHQLFLRWNENDAGLMSAAVAYYAVLSMFPLLLILTSGLGVFLKWTNAGQDAHDYILSAISDQLSPALAQHVQVALEQVQQHASFSGPVGFATLLVAAMAMFAQFERAFDRIWKIETQRSTTFAQTVWRVVTHRMRAFLMLIAVGVAIVVVFFAGVGFDAFRAFTQQRYSDSVSLTQSVSLWWWIETLLIVLLNATVFALLYRFLPKAPVRWLHAFRGGLFAAAGWEFGRQLLASFVIGQRYSNAYGLIGSLLAIMLWAYYSFAAIFLGAVYAQLLGEEQATRSGPATGSGSGSGPRKGNPPLPGEAVIGLLLVYIASFLAVRQFCTYEVPDRPLRSTVLFSRTSDGQQWGKLIYAPLIATLPGPYEYPNGVELPQVLKQLDASALQGSN